ncbi:hypothetical protein OB905_08765 [Halobacteria archaeon AArc-dxtr1]|nr:hypothetical protein [Halobacteria archaeon AArc-dxtr1]
MADELETVRAKLVEASETTADGDLAADIRDGAAGFEELVKQDREPDHAVLDGRLNELRQLRERADGEAASTLEEAVKTAESYREQIQST